MDAQMASRSFIMHWRNFVSISICSLLLTPAAWAIRPDTNPGVSVRIEALELAVSDLQVLVTTQQGEIVALENRLSGVTRGADPNTGQDTLTFSGMNVQIVNGMGTTESTNATGNLIIGYNEQRDWAGGANYRDGSHMLVIGNQHNYSAEAYGGMLIGRHNDVTGHFASVSGGAGNTASGL